MRGGGDVEFNCEASLRTHFRLPGAELLVHFPSHVHQQVRPCARPRQSPNHGRRALFWVELPRHRGERRPPSDVHRDSQLIRGGLGDEARTLRLSSASSRSCARTSCEASGRASGGAEGGRHGVGKGIQL